MVPVGEWPPESAPESEIGEPTVPFVAVVARAGLALATVDVSFAALHAELAAALLVSPE